MIHILSVSLVFMTLEYLNKFVLIALHNLSLNNITDVIFRQLCTKGYVGVSWHTELLLAPRIKTFHLPR